MAKMIRKIARRGKKFVKKITGRNGPDKKAIELYQKFDYLEAYSRHIDLRVERDPKSAVGGRWDEIGKFQFDFIIQMGLKPYHKMLDIGCGTLRGGRYFIQYLDSGNYTGIDISQKAISFAKHFVEQEGLSEKSPRLIVNEKKTFDFLAFPGEVFNYILAQSVFTHNKPEHIKACFENIGIIMDDNSSFYFTYWSADKYKRVGFKDFRYPYIFFEILSQRYGFELFDYSDVYIHPKRQQILGLKKIR